MVRPADRSRVAPKPRTFYLDASAMVKRYLAEIGSTWVEALCADETIHAIAIAHIGVVEVAAAFAAKRRGNYVTLDFEQTGRANIGLRRLVV